MKLATITENKHGFVDNIEKRTEDNTNFRQVLYTGEHSQLVVMTLPPGEDIGLETHDVDQFFRIEEGTGEVTINGHTQKIEAGTGLIIPAGAKHNIKNTGDQPLQIYTIYSPPQHKDGTTHKTKNAAQKAEEHFDGKTTE